MAWHSFPPHNQSESSLPIDFRIGLSADLAKIRRILCLYVYISLHGPMNFTISSFGIVAFFQQHWIFNPLTTYTCRIPAFSDPKTCLAIPIKVPIPHFHLEWRTYMYKQWFRRVGHLKCIHDETFQPTTSSHILTRCVNNRFFVVESVSECIHSHLTQLYNRSYLNRSA